jgi:hypothetical protein
MNWYKKSQQERPESYFDVGHYNDNRIVLWMSDTSGDNFRMQEVDENNRNHAQAFGYGQQTRNQNIWGRYDEGQKMVSMALPLDPRIKGETIDPNELPNRLMDRLISEFPGASIYGFGNGGQTVRIT